MINQILLFVCSESEVFCFAHFLRLLLSLFKAQDCFPRLKMVKKVVLLSFGCKHSHPKITWR